MINKIILNRSIKINEKIIKKYQLINKIIKNHLIITQNLSPKYS